MTLSPRRIPPALGALALAAAVLAGCSSSGDDADAADAATTTRDDPVAASTTMTSPQPTPATVDLLDPGAEPRSAVAFRFEEGTTSTTVLTTDQLVVLRRGTDRQQVDPPPIHQEVRTEVVEADASGARMEQEIVRVWIDGDDPELEAVLEPTVGTVVTYRTDPHGATSDWDLELPDDAPEAVADQVRQFVDQGSSLNPPLPTEPIGVGARWRTTSTTQIDGVELTMVATYTATDLDDEALAFDLAVEMPVAGDAGATGTFTGTGKGTIHLDGTAATQRSRLSGEQTIEVSDGPGAGEVTQEVRIDTSVVPSG